MTSEGGGEGGGESREGISVKEVCGHGILMEEFVVEVEQGKKNKISVRSIYLGVRKARRSKTLTKGSQKRGNIKLTGGRKITYEFVKHAFVLPVN